MRKLLLLAILLLAGCSDPALDCRHQWGKWEDSDLKNGFGETHQARYCVRCNAKQLRKVTTP